MGTRAHLIADAICRACEALWSRDRNIERDETRAVLDVLSTMYLLRDVVRAELT